MWVAGKGKHLPARGDTSLSARELRFVKRGIVYHLAYGLVRISRHLRVTNRMSGVICTCMICCQRLASPPDERRGCMSTCS